MRIETGNSRAEGAGDGVVGGADRGLDVEGERRGRGGVGAGGGVRVPVGEQGRLRLGGGAGGGGGPAGEPGLRRLVHRGSCEPTATSTGCGGAGGSGSGQRKEMGGKRRDFFFSRRIYLLFTVDGKILSARPVPSNIALYLWLAAAAGASK